MISAMFFAAAALVCVFVATAIYMHSRNNVGRNSEREEFAKAHRIVMQMARMYQMDDKSLEKYRQLLDLREQVIAYHAEAVGSQIQESDESRVVYSFDKVKYRANE